MHDLYLSSNPRRTAREEAAHAAAARRLGLEVNYVSCMGDKSSSGRASVKANGNGAALIVVQLIGKIAIGTKEWPPMYVDAVNEEMEGLGELLRLLDVSLSTYERLADVARTMAADPLLLRGVDRLEEALLHFGYLNGKQVDTFITG